MPLISIYEYEKLRIGESEASRPSVTRQQARDLRALTRTYGFDVFKLVDEDILAAQKYVGVVQIGALTVEVLPKIDGLEEKNVRQNLVGMLAVALDLDISEGDIASVGLQNQSVLEILIRLFCEKLFAQVRRGLVRSYEQHEENLPFLRGRLGIAEQIRRNSANPERMYCRFDEFREDNPLNQILKAAVRLLLGLSRSLTNQRSLAELLLMFESITSVPRRSLPWERLSFNRLNERYRSSCRLAELFLKGTPPDVGAGKAHGFSLFFDMSSLFEEYIGRMAKLVFSSLGYRVVLQGPTRYLAYDERKNCDAFALRPDVVGIMNSRTCWIIDTKWKKLQPVESREGVSQSDLYQMYAYAKCYASSDVVLLYPHHSRLGDESGDRASYRLTDPLNLHGEASHGRVRVATVALQSLADVPRQLRSLFEIPQHVKSV